MNIKNLKIKCLVKYSFVFLQVEVKLSLQYRHRSMRFIFYWGLDMIKICVPTEVELKIFITVCVLGYVLRLLLTPMTFVMM